MLVLGSAARPCALPKQPTWHVLQQLRKRRRSMCAEAGPHAHANAVLLCCCAVTAGPAAGTSLVVRMRRSIAVSILQSVSLSAVCTCCWRLMRFCCCLLQALGYGPPELVTCGRDGCVRVWDVRQEDAPVAAFEPADTTNVRCAAAECGKAVVRGQPAACKSNTVLGDGMLRIPHRRAADSGSGHCCQSLLQTWHVSDTAKAPLQHWQCLCNLAELAPVSECVGVVLLGTAGVWHLATPTTMMTVVSWLATTMVM